MCGEVLREASRRAMGDEKCVPASRTSRPLFIHIRNLVPHVPKRPSNRIVFSTRLSFGMDRQVQVASSALVLRINMILRKASPRHELSDHRYGNPRQSPPRPNRHQFAPASPALLLTVCVFTLFFFLAECQPVNPLAAKSKPYGDGRDVQIVCIHL